MAKMTFVEGQTATNPTTKEKIVYSKGKWWPEADVPVDAPKSVGPEARVRFGIGMGPAIEAQKNLFAAEEWNQNQRNTLGSNPYDTTRGTLASMISGKPGEAGPFRTRLTKMAGGQRYQDYEQAAKSFESSFMPILSGAAVSESEAARLIKASLPEPGDSPLTLAKKAKNRAMMMNGAAELIGEPKPFPRIESWKFTPKQGGRASPQTPPSPATQRPSLDEIFGQ